MKEKWKVLLYGLPLFLFFGWWIRSDYTWAQDVVEHESKDGWVLVNTLDNTISLTSPWTIIKTPTSTVFFVKRDSVKKIDNQYLQVDELIVSNPDFSGTKRSEIASVLDCRNVRRGSRDQEIDNTEQAEQIKWHEYESDSPALQTIKNICALFSI